MLKVAIIGGSGYTGLELLRLLSQHPEVEIATATSRQYAGRLAGDVFPWLKESCVGLKFTEPKDLKKIRADLAFTCLPHGASQDAVVELLNSGKKVIDLSADFRLKNAAVYKKWYNEAHKAKTHLKKAVYGLPELNRDLIKGATLVANPGCYPTGAILALAPLVKNGLIDKAPGSIIIDSKSGVSGAGRQASLDTSFVEVCGAFKAYKVGCHRHLPEIEQGLSYLAGAAIEATFTPHLLPVSRGILTTAYARLKNGAKAHGLLGLYSSFYKDEPFIRLMPQGQSPDISHVRGSNMCAVGVWADAGKKTAIVISAIDNLVKGASGQAVQNMNIMSGFEETAGLEGAPLTI